MSRTGSLDNGNGSTLSRRSSYDLDLPAVFPSMFTGTRERQIIADPWQFDNPAIRQLSSAARRRNRPRLHSAGSRLLLVDGRQSSGVARVRSPSGRLEKLPGEVSPKVLHSNLPNDFPVLPDIRSPSVSPEPRRSYSDLEKADQRFIASPPDFHRSESNITSSVSLGSSDGQNLFGGDSTFGSASSLRSRSRSSSRSRQHTTASSQDNTTNGSSRVSKGHVTEERKEKGKSSQSIKQAPIMMPNMMGDEEEEGEEEEEENRPIEYTEVNVKVEVMKKHSVSSSGTSQSPNYGGSSTLGSEVEKRPQPPSQPKAQARVHPSRRRHGDLETLRKQVQGQVKNVLEGNLKGLVPLPSNMVKVFISSTGTDMHEELMALRKTVFPRLRQFCEDLNMDFQVCDLHSVSGGKARSGPEVSQLCLKEIEYCQKHSFGPSFVTLIGNKYGKYLLPRIIPQEDFNVLHTVLEMETPEHADLLIQHYQLEDNNKSYRLQESNVENDTAKLISIITSAARMAHAQDMMTDECFRRLHTTALELELYHGIFNVRDAKKKCIALCRDLDGLIDDVRNPLAPSYMDIDFTEEEGGRGGPTANYECLDTLNHIKQNKLKKNLGENNVHFYTPWWQTKGLETNKCQRNSNYLNLMCRHFYEDIKRLIANSVKALNTVWKDVDEEAYDLYVDAHQHLAIIDKGRESYVDCHDRLGKVAEMLAKDPKKVMFIYGPRGSGKTCLISEIAGSVVDIVDGPCIKIIRFLSTSHPTLNMPSVLRSICCHICASYNIDNIQESDQGDDGYGVYVIFIKLLETVSDMIATDGKRNLVIFLDSIDCVNDLSWIPRILPNGIIMICTSIEPPAFASISNSNLLQLRTFTMEEANETATKILKQNDRIMEGLLDGILYKEKDENNDNRSLEEVTLKVASALYLNQNRKDGENAPLTGDITEMLKRVFDNIESLTDIEIVRGYIGYLSISPEGITESELQEMLVSNKAISAVLERRDCSREKGQEKEEPGDKEAETETEFIPDPSLLSYDTAVFRHALNPFLMRKTAIRGLEFLEFSNEKLKQYLLSKSIDNQAELFQLHEDLLHFYLHRYNRYTSKYSTTSKARNKDIKLQIKHSQERNLLDRYLRLSVYHLIKSELNPQAAKKLMFCNFNWLSKRLHTSKLLIVIQDLRFFIQHLHLGSDEELQLLLKCLCSSVALNHKISKESLEACTKDMYILFKSCLMYDPERHPLLHNLLEEGKTFYMEIKENNYILLPVHPVNMQNQERLLEGEMICFHHKNSRDAYVVQMSQTTKGLIFSLPDLVTINHRGVLPVEGSEERVPLLILSPDGRTAVTFEDGFLSQQELLTGSVSKFLSLEDDGQKVTVRHMTVDFRSMVVIAVTMDDILFTIDLSRNEIIGRYPDERDSLRLRCEERQAPRLQDLEDDSQSWSDTILDNLDDLENGEPERDHTDDLKDGEPEQDQVDNLIEEGPERDHVDHLKEGGPERDQEDNLREGGREKEQEDNMEDLKGGELKTEAGNSMDDLKVGEPEWKNAEMLEDVERGRQKEDNMDNSKDVGPKKEETDDLKDDISEKGLNINQKKDVNNINVNFTQQEKQMETISDSCEIPKDTHGDINGNTEEGKHKETKIELRANAEGDQEAIEAIEKDKNDNDETNTTVSINSNEDNQGEESQMTKEGESDPDRTKDSPLESTEEQLVVNGILPNSEDLCNDDDAVNQEKNKEKIEKINYTASSSQSVDDNGNVNRDETLYVQSDVEKGQAIPKEEQSSFTEDKGSENADQEPQDKAAKNNEDLASQGISNHNSSEDIVLTNYNDPQNTTNCIAQDERVSEANIESSNFNGQELNLSGTQNLNEVQNVNNAEVGIKCFKLSPNQQKLAIVTRCVNGCSLIIWNTSNWEKLITLDFPSSNSSCVYFSSNSLNLVIDLFPKDYAVIDIASSKVTFTVDDIKGNMYNESSNYRPCVVFSKRNEHFALPVGDKYISFYTLEKGENIQTLDCDQRCSLLALNENEHFLIASEGLRTISMWQIITASRIWSYTYDEEQVLNDLIIGNHKNDTFLYVILNETSCVALNVTSIVDGSRNGYISLIKDERIRLQELELHSKRNYPETYSGIDLIKSTVNKGELSERRLTDVYAELPDWQPEGTMHHDVLLTPDGRFLISADRTSGITIYDVTTTKPVTSINCTDIWRVHIANDGLTLICTTHSKHLLFYTLERDTWQMIDRLHNITHLAVDSVSISTDGRTIVVIRKDDFLAERLHIYVIDLVTCHVMAHLMANIEIKDTQSVSSLTSHLSLDHTHLVIIYHFSDTRPSQFVICDLYKEMNMDVPAWTLGSPSSLPTSGSRVVVPLGISIEEHCDEIDGDEELDDEENDSPTNPVPWLLSVPSTPIETVDHVYPERLELFSQSQKPTQSPNPLLSDSSNPEVQSFGAIEINVVEDNSVPEHLISDGAVSMNLGLLGASLTPVNKIDINLDAQVTAYPTGPKIGKSSLITAESYPTLNVESENTEMKQEHTDEFKSVVEGTNLTIGNAHYLANTGEMTMRGNLQVPEQSLSTKYELLPPEYRVVESSSAEVQEMQQESLQELSLAVPVIDMEQGQGAPEKAINHKVISDTSNATEKHTKEKQTDSLSNVNNGMIDKAENREDAAMHIENATDSVTKVKYVDTVTRPVSSQSRPGSTLSQSRPGTSHSRSRPAMTQSNPRPGTAGSRPMSRTGKPESGTPTIQSNPRPASAQDNSRPSSAKTNSRPASVQSNSRPGTGKSSSSRPPSSQSDGRPGTTQSNSRPGTSEQKSRPGSAQSEGWPNSRLTSAQISGKAETIQVMSEQGPHKSRTETSESGENTEIIESNDIPGSTQTVFRPETAESKSKPDAAYSRSKSQSDDTNNVNKGAESNSRPGSSQSNSRPESVKLRSRPGSSQTRSRPGTAQSDASPAHVLPDPMPAKTQPKGKPGGADFCDSSQINNSRPNSAQSETILQTQEIEEAIDTEMFERKLGSSHSSSRPHSAKSSSRTDSSELSSQPKTKADDTDRTNPEGIADNTANSIEPEANDRLAELEENNLLKRTAEGSHARGHGHLKRLDSLSVIQMPRPVRQASEMSLNLPFDFEDEPPADTENPTGRRRLVGHLPKYVSFIIKDPEKCVATLEDQQVIVGTNKGNLIILDLRTGTPKQVLLHCPQLDNGESLRKVLEFEANDCPERDDDEIKNGKPHLATIQHVCVSHDIKFVVASSNDTTLTAWQLDELQFLNRFEGHTDKVTWSDISWDNSLLVSGGEDGTVRLWQFSTATPLHIMHLCQPVFQVKFSFGDVHVMARMGRTGYGRFAVFKIQRLTCSGQISPSSV